MFYVAEDKYGDLEIRETDLTTKRGTWHHWRDKTAGMNRVWKSRGLGPVRSLKLAAIEAYAEDNPEDVARAVYFAFTVGGAGEWREGFARGEAVGKIKGRRELQDEIAIAEAESRRAPKTRSFLRRFLSGRPFAAA